MARRNRAVVDVAGCRGRLQPRERAFRAEREGRRNAARAPLIERARRIGEKRLRQQEPRVDAHRRQLGRAARRKEIHLAESHVGEQLPRLILDDIRQGTHDQQTRSRVRRLRRQGRDQRRQAGIFALRESGLDAAARVVEDPHPRRETAGQPQRRAGQIEFDHLGRAGADQEQKFDIRAPRQELTRPPGRVPRWHRQARRGRAHR